MRRLSPMMASASAAALTTLAVTVAVPAIAEDGRSPKSHVVKAGPSEKELRSCLKKQGVEAPGDDARALKRWLLEHGDGAPHRGALKACDMAPAIKRVGPGECAKGGAVAMAIPAGHAEKVTTFESGGIEVHEVGDER